MVELDLDSKQMDPRKAIPNHEALTSCQWFSHSWDRDAFGVGSGLQGEAFSFCCPLLSLNSLINVPEGL